MEPEVSIDGPDTILICRGDTVQLTQTNNVADAGLRWSPEEGLLSALGDPTATVVPVVSRYYKVTVSNADGTASDSVYINVNQLIVPELIADTTVCEGTALPLVRSLVDNTRGTTYQYSPSRRFVEPTDVNSLVTPTAGGRPEYTLISTSADGICADTQLVSIQVTPSRLTISQPDTVFRCNDEDPLSLLVTAAPDVTTGEITWSPRQGIIDDLAQGGVNVRPTKDITYFVSAEVNGCPQTDSVHIRVDSLPTDLSLTSEPVMDPFCIGDTFNLRGEVFDVGDFPLIQHQWLTSPGIQSPERLYQGIFIAQDSALYQRQTVNGACVDTAEIQINVIKPPILIKDPENPVACPGEPLQLNVSFDPTRPAGELTWMDPTGALSCTECLDPVVTTNQSVTFMIEVIAEGSDCPSMDSYTVNIAPDVSPDLTTNTVVCPGTSLSLITGNVRDGIEYEISGGGQVLLDPNAEVTPTQTTTYTVTARNPAFEASSACGTVTQEITIQVADTYELFLDAPTSVCVGEQANFTARVEPNTPGVFSYTFGNGGTSQGANASLNITRDTTVSVTFIDNAGCNSLTQTATVLVDLAGIQPGIDATTLNGTEILGTAIIQGAEIVLTATGVPDDFSGTITWASNNGSPSTGTGRSITVRAPEEGRSLSYTLTVNPDNGCESSAFITFELVEEPFAIPEIISANQDGLNDDFQVFFTGGTAVDDFSLLVFNRFGQEVFNSSDPEEGWDGTKNGSPQNLGTYLFLTKFTIAGQEFQREGQFSLVR
ncbi:hypothetical protein A3850_011000 [Lewinella sp. 4G2]|nr:hypothetical protein A3850_011000 [Lewinella sp. 4G2]